MTGHIFTRGTVVTHTARRRPGLLAAGALAAVLALAVGSAPTAYAATTDPINGSGSGWAANAVNQWIADVTPNGLRVTYTANGSATGRKNFAYKTTDFAVSDIGFQGNDEVTGDTDTSQGRPYAYLPIVAGGTSFPYQIRVGGKLVQDLRLSGLTLAKIFTNQITNWNDPAITKDNNGRSFPSIPIIPVVHSEGSGSTAQFTRYLDTVYPDVWRPFRGRPGLTEYFPRKGMAVAQNGSDGVINYITSAAANGAIGFDEYSYALAKNHPVAKIQNAAGYFTLPTQYNVAVALTQAQINLDKNSPNYLLQNLDNVYTYGDKRTYALSSYSYMIIPTSGTDPTMSTGKRQSLANYLYYSICDGQQAMGPIGYSPLPLNLVQASFDQTAKLQEADPKVYLTSRNVSTCRNPTFVAGQPNRNYLAEIAPQPAACDQVGQGPCTGAVDRAINRNPTGGVAPPAAGGRSASPRAGGASASAGGGSPGSGGSAPGSSPGSSPGSVGAVTGPAGGSAGATPGGASTGPSGTVAAAVVDPETGQVVGGGTAAGASPGSTAGLGSGIDPNQTGVPIELASAPAVPTSTMAALAGLLLLLVVALPPFIAHQLSRHGARSPR